MAAICGLVSARAVYVCIWSGFGFEFELLTILTFFLFNTQLLANFFDQVCVEVRIELLGQFENCCTSIFFFFFFTFLIETSKFKSGLLWYYKFRIVSLVNLWKLCSEAKFETIRNKIPDKQLFKSGLLFPNY